jgi:hypothetical protein
MNNLAKPDQQKSGAVSLLPLEAKTCNHLICTLLMYFDIEISEVNGNVLEHLEGILDVIKEILNGL